MVFDKMEQLREEINRKQRELEQMEKQYFDINGIWKVTTEGDVEGRSTKTLGTFKGNLLDIAKKLHEQAYYKLDFERTAFLPEEEKKEVKKETKKSVQFTVRDKTIKLYDQQQQYDKLIEHVSPGETLSIGNYYGAVKLEWEEK